MCVSCGGKAIVQQRGEGEAIWFDGGLLTVKTSPENTAGGYAVFEYVAPAGKASPLHHHPDADETFYVLEGEILAHVDGVEHRAGAGATVTFLRGVPHAYATSQEARILMVLIPGAGLNFFRDAGEPAGAAGLPPPRERNFEQFQAAAAGNGVVLLGPPPFDMTSLPVR